MSTGLLNFLLNEQEGGGSRPPEVIKLITEIKGLCDDGYNVSREEFETKAGHQKAMDRLQEVSDKLARVIELDNDPDWIEFKKGADILIERLKISIRQF